MRKQMAETGGGETTGVVKFYLEEQANHWKAFVVDLFVGTARRMVVSPLAFGGAFLVVAFLINRVGIAEQGTYTIVKYVEGFFVFLLYGIAGILCGIAYGAVSTVHRKVDELERGVHLIVEPITAAIISRMPGNEKGIGLTEFTDLLDGQVAEFSKASRSQFRILSIARTASNFFVRNTLRIMRYTFLNDFVDSLKEKGEIRISAKSVESFARETLLSKVVNRFTGRLDVVEYALYGVTGVLLIVPFLMIVL